MPGWGSRAGAPFGAAEIARLRPTRIITVNLTPIVSALQVAGYVTLGPEGWATAVGCATIEQSRAVETMVRMQNGCLFRLILFGGSLT
jgi:hypothetical protein